MKTIKDYTGMPKMRAAFAGWMTFIELVKIEQNIVDGFVEQSEVYLKFRGTVQPLSPDKIMLKPEGQRSWEWLQIHCFATNMNLATNDRIKWAGQIYKIMAILDYSLNNYIEYHIIKDYQND